MEQGILAPNTNRKSFKSWIVTFLMPLIRLFKIVLLYALPERIYSRNTIDIVKDRSIESSADFIEEHGESALLFSSRFDLWRFSLEKVTSPGLFLEFGVSWGKSISFFAQNIPISQTIYGFDSFEGLQEDFTGTSFRKGAFSTGGILPKVPSNVTLIKGWFVNTIPKFLQERNEKISFIHLDADTYESTQEILNLIGDRLVKGSIIIFDEYLGVPNWKNNEHKAWLEFCQENNINCKYLAFSNQSVALTIV